jgi:hypothetical protein
MTARGRIFTIAAGVLATVVSSSGAVAAETTQQTTKAERVAERFLDAYGSFNAKQALKYLSEEGIVTGSGHTAVTWGSRGRIPQGGGNDQGATDQADGDRLPGTG